MTTYYVNGEKKTKEELEKIEIKSSDLKRVIIGEVGGEFIYGYNNNGMRKTC